MRIVTLNTWKNEGDYPQRLALMAKGLGALEPTVVCLQECFIGGGWNTATFLAGALDLHATTAPARAKLREHLGGWVHSTSGLAVLTREPPAAHAVLALASDPRDGERIALRVDLPGLRILDLHLTHLRGASASALRAAQLDEALAWARSGWSGALVVCGDLNCGRGDPEFTALAAAAGAELGSTLLGHAGLGRAIDHAVLAEPGALHVAQRFRALDQADAAGRFPSDHAAVVVDLDA